MTREMKGTPFFTGEYAKRKGPAEKRLNLWPAFYYRDPALSVAWPVIEVTDDHFALRPVFSIYGLDRTNREYNVFWPLVQINRQSGNNHVFPAFWGADHRVLFPLYWHFGQPLGEKGGKDSLFPLWVLERHGTNRFSLHSPWPLVHRWSDEKRQEKGSMVFPLYWQSHNQQGSHFFSLPYMSGAETNGESWRMVFPLYYQKSNAVSSAVVTPLWAQGHSETNSWQALVPFCYWDRDQHTVLSPLWAQWQEGDRQTYWAPWALSWLNRQPERNDLWLGGFLAHASWGEKPGPNHVFPLYVRNTSQKQLLTPICGWRGDNKGYFYPLTPLAGVRTGEQSGHWLYPLYSYEVKKTGESKTRLALIAGHDKNKEQSHWWLFPAFLFYNYGPLTSVPESAQRNAKFGKEFWCLPVCWYVNQNRFSSDDPKKTLLPFTSPSTNALLTREYYFKNGVFPLWSYSTNSMPGKYKSSSKASVGVILYDYKHELGPFPAKKSTAPNDYTRARVLWRLWHYERLNGDVGVDVFPTITYDTKKDGYKKITFLWRFFRYERTALGTKEMDVLYVPVMRKSSLSPTPPTAAK